MEDNENKDVEDLILDELDACDWDLSEDSMENIARKVQNKFSSYGEALDYVYGMTTSMIDDMKKD